jgi:hypothetical protein
MGLTHHWERPTELPREAFRAAIEDCRTLLAVSEADIAGFDGTGEPILDEDRIVFNGQAPRACEPFEIAAVEFDRRGRPEVFGHCKTGHLPYDLYVRASLIVLAHHLRGALRMTSDADSTDWGKAQSLVEQSLGYGGDFSLSPD